MVGTILTTEDGTVLTTETETNSIQTPNYIGRVEMANQALGKMRARAQISSLSEDSPEANAINLAFSTTLRRMLRRHDWNFAKRATTLALLKTATGEPWSDAQPMLPWAYAYAVPDKCVKMRDVLGQPLVGVQGLYTSPGYKQSGQRYQFAVYSETLNGINVPAIGVNAANAIGIFTALLEDPRTWIDSFADAFTSQLAADVCIPLGGDLKLATTLSKYATDTLTEARIRDANEGSENTQGYIPDFILARGDGGWR